MNIKQILLLATTLPLTSTASAAIITYGNLTSDNTTNYIEDTVTGRQYLRFDTFDLSYTAVVTATSTGGIYADWNIATSVIADEFASAILGVSSTPCSGSMVYGTLCGVTGTWTDGAFGNSYDWNNDYFAFDSTQTTPAYGSGQEVGLMRIGSNGYIYKYDDWGPRTSLDGYYGTSSINLLLYRDDPVSPIPVPAAAWLFGSGLLGLIGVARRKTRG